MLDNGTTRAQVVLTATTTRGLSFIAAITAADAALKAHGASTDTNVELLSVTDDGSAELLVQLVVTTNQIYYESFPELFEWATEQLPVRELSVRLLHRVPTCQERLLGIKLPLRSHRFWMLSWHANYADRSGGLELPVRVEHVWLLPLFKNQEDRSLGIELPVRAH